jgi:protein involved in polysaccharide export with SLBB domain
MYPALSEGNFGGPSPADSRVVTAFRFFCTLAMVSLFIGSNSGLHAQIPSPVNPSSPADTNCSESAYPGSDSCVNQNAQQRQFQGLQQPGSQYPGQGSTQPEMPGLYTDQENQSRQQQGNTGPRRMQLPPEPLTEFQKFVATTTGEVLPIFGANLFQGVPSTFAPVDMAPVPADYLIGPDDELRIRVWGQVSFEADLRVDRSGEIYLPRVGPVHVAGLRYSELNEHLRAAIARVFRNFELTVDLGRIRAIQIYVTGQARRPGVYTVSSLSTLLDAVFEGGGPSTQGSLRRIQLRRGGKVITELDLYSLLSRGDTSGDAKLLSGDIVFIPPVGPQVALTGSVQNPRIYELKPNETLSELFEDAGGLSAVAAGSRISIERIDDHRDRHAMEVSFDSKDLATVLASGDLVRVYPITPQFQKTVTLRGNTANPGRFAWHTGMRVSELIPDKESLLTRNYWWKRTQLGLPAPEFQPFDNLSSMRQPTRVVTLPQNRTQRQYMRQNPDGSTQLQDRTEPLQDPSEPLQEPLLPLQNRSSDSDSPPYNDSANPANRRQTAATPAAASGSLAAQQFANDQYGAENRIPKTEVRIIAPEIDWDYAVIERLDPETLKTTLVPFDLGKLVMQHDGSQDLELRPGDVVTVFSEADIRIPVGQQTKIVKLEGEFAHGGSYTVGPNETLRQLVQRAGGFTSSAYLYGSEFARLSTRAIQQARMDEYIRTLEAEIQRGNLASVTAAASSAQDIASSVAAHTSEQDLIARLREVRATGRIVLEFQPDSSGIASIPDVPLENGDTFLVPSRPANVNVIGAVYDQNSFLYNRSRNVGAYLHLAGGPNRNSDYKHSFVIRADGEVVSRDSVSGLWKNSFLSMNVNPGDTVVVPEKTFKPTALRGFLDWSQIFSQLALGAAAIQVLK